MIGKGKETQPDQVVSDSGPLISLSTIGKLDLLKAVFGHIVIPQAVYDEVVVHGAGEFGSTEVSQAEWIEISQVKDALAVDILEEVLGTGESEALVLAQELNVRYVLIDDALARRKARLIGLHITSTLGVLLMAKETGIISTIKPLLDELRQTDFRMSDKVYQEILVKANEVD